MALVLDKRFLKMTSRLLVLVYLIGTVKECKSQKSSRCTSKETCSECMAEDPTCAWCSQEANTNWEKPRCDAIENLKKGRCDNIISPQNSIRPIMDQPLSRRGETEGKAIQIKPQMVNIHLRPNSVATFSLKYHQAVDYPVDLYLLMDLSYTMKDDKQNLARLGETLGLEMQRITSDFRLGFGSFVDKVVEPYSDTHPYWMRAACPRGDCVKTYSFKNHMPLSSDIGEFVNKVSDSEISANVDPPEGTLDAIMQAIVCEHQIGWRPMSRKLIVIATDEDFHYAGDGKLGGIIKPNDCKCHLDNNGVYTESGQLDYPSLSQMKKKIKEHNVYLIFAVPEKRVPHYQILSSRLPATTVAKLAKDSSNIVTLIKEQYNKLSSTIEMTETVHGPYNIKVSYYSQCLNETRKMRNICRGIKPGHTVTFDVSLEFSVCPKNRRDWNQKIEIHPVGLSDNLTVHLSLICRCDCAQDRGKEAENRYKWCNGRGTYECGICKCDDSAYGIACECDSEASQTQSNSTACKYGNDEYECSGRGECQCGKCVCDQIDNEDEKYYGNYCECSNFNCYQNNRKICSGHGECVCGVCMCDKDWTGPDCSCTVPTETCVRQTGEEICSGHGECVCGLCNCGENYYGTYCEDCQTCPGKCEQYSSCVRCILAAKESGNTPETCKNCEASFVELVENIEVNKIQNEKMCTIMDKDSCKITFKYRMDDYNSVSIQIQEKKECPAVPDVLTIAASTAGGAFLAGLVALFIVRICIEIHDEREWAKFQKDLDKAQWDSGNNPIFIEPSSTFQNPVFRPD